MVLLAAAGLRLWRLGEPKPGLYRDEAIEACQGLALAHGRTLPEATFTPFLRYPVWEAVEAGSLALAGPTPFAARLPAAVGGVAVVALAFVAFLPAAGFWPALLVAGFHAVSFWELVYSRTATAPSSLVFLLGAALGWLALRAPGPVPVRRGFAAGLVAGLALPGYLAGAHLLAVLPFLLLFRLEDEPGFRPFAARWALGALAGMAGPALLVAFHHGGWKYAGAYPVLPLVRWAGGLREHLLALVTGAAAADPRPGLWGACAFLGSLLSPLEVAIVVPGLLALGLRGPGRRPAAIGLGWFVLALLPALAGDTDGVRTTRMIGVPVALGWFVAAGGMLVARRAPRLLPALVLGWIALAGAQAGHRYFVVWREDPRVTFWSERPWVEAVLDLKEEAANGRVALVPPSPHYADMAWFHFLLAPEIAAGRVILRPEDTAGWVVVAEYRDGVRRQPMAFLLRPPGARSSGEVRRRAVVSAQAYLAPCGRLLAAGRVKDALDFVWPISRTHPDFGLAHLRLAEIFDRAGDPLMANSERALAAGLGVAATSEGEGVILP